MLISAFVFRLQNSKIFVVSVCEIKNLYLFCWAAKLGSSLTRSKDRLSHDEAHFSQVMKNVVLLYANNYVLAVLASPYSSLSHFMQFVLIAHSPN